METRGEELDDFLVLKYERYPVDRCDVGNTDHLITGGTAVGVTKYHVISRDMFTAFSALTVLDGRQEEHPACKT